MAAGAGWPIIRNILILFRVILKGESPVEAGLAVDRKIAPSVDTQPEIGTVEVINTGLQELRDYLTAQYGGS